MAARGYTPPAPISEVVDAWSAFMRVASCRHYTVGGAGPPNWSDIRAVLELYGSWNLVIHRRLSVCFNELMLMEAEQRKAENG